MPNPIHQCSTAKRAMTAPPTMVSGHHVRQLRRRTAPKVVVQIIRLVEKFFHHFIATTAKADDTHIDSIIGRGSTIPTQDRSRKNRGKSGPHGGLLQELA